MASWWTASGGGGTAIDGAARETTTTHYDVLRLARDADAASIRAAYQREVLRCHPDKQATANDDGKNDGEEERRRRFDAVQVAYGALRDPEARAQYDAQLARRAQMEAASQITPAEELDLSEMDMEEEKEEEEEDEGEAGAGGGEGEGGEQRSTAAADAATAAAASREKRREVATYPCRCGDLYRLPMRAVRAATLGAAAGAAGQAPPPPPSLLVQCRGCSNHALVRLPT